MEIKTEIRKQILNDERALFHVENVRVVDTIFQAGESPLKECNNLELEGCMFKWKYPLWYTDNVVARNCKWFDMARAGVWYSDHITVDNAMIEAPKNFRRCKDLTLRDVNFYNALETLWNCDQVTLENVSAKGDYFAMNTNNLKINNFKLDGNYSFDGCNNVEMHNSTLLSRDAFWNCDNVVVYDSFICGEYLGWNSKNLTLINCTIESLQGMCYIDNLVMKNCKLINTNLAFEYSNVDVEVDDVVSVLNPETGVIKADSIGELIIQKNEIDPSRTKIICKNIVKETDILTF